MKSLGLFFAAVVVAFAAVWATGHLVTPSSQTTHESAYDRVMRTRTVRCSYADWPPSVFLIDPNTHAISGILHDITEAIGKHLEVKIEWTEETGWSNFIEGLQSRRTDAFCAGLWHSPERGGYVTYSKPLFYSAVYPYVRTNDHRFDDDLSLANRPEIKISTMDGDMADTTARNYFPDATKVSVIQLGHVSDLFNNIATNKADIVFTEFSFGNGYMSNNPGLIRKIGDKPYQVFSTSYGFEIHETLLREVFDNAITELMDLGVIDKIISKYSKDQGEFLRVAYPYRQ